MLRAALLLQHTTPAPGPAQNLLLQAALKLLDQLQKVALSVGVHPPIRHLFPRAICALLLALPLPLTAPSSPAVISQPPEINTTPKYFSK